MALKRSRSGSDSSSASSSDSDSEIETRKRPIKNVYSSSDSKSSDEEEEWNAKPAKAKAKSKPAKKVAKLSNKSKQKRAKQSDSDNDSKSDSDSESGSESSGSDSRSPPAKKKFDKEEGEVDFDSDSSEEFNDGFDENLMGDEEDQKRLATMTEKEREQELFNRSEKRELLRARFEIGRKLKKKKSAEPDASTKKDNKKSNKKKSESSNDEDENEDRFDYSSVPDIPSRSTERRRQIEDNRKGKESIEILKAEREKKKLKQKLRAADVFSDSSDSDSGKDRKRRSSSSSSDSSSSSNEDSDDDSTSRRKSRRNRGRDEEHEKKEKFVMTLQNLNALIVTRNRIQEWCFAPFFKNTITGCFVRVRSQLAKSQYSYVVGEVLAVVETPKTYQLGTRGRTNLGLKIRSPGVPDQTFRLEFVSNQYCSEDEFNVLAELMEKHGVSFVSRDHYEAKIRDLDKAKNYNYTDADIDYEVKQKEKFKTRPVNFAMKKAELMKEKNFAEQNNDHEKAMELGREIDRLEMEAKEIEKKRTEHIKSISYINERNRNKNILDGSLSNSSGGHQAIADDPFTRRRCAPQIYTKNKHTDVNNENKAENKEEEAKSAAGDPVPKKEEKKNSICKNDDMFDAHNFEIKLDLPLSTPDTSLPNSILADLDSSVFSKPTNPVPKIENNRRLNLEEYKRKKGLI